MSDARWRPHAGTARRHLSPDRAATGNVLTRRLRHSGFLSVEDARRLAEISDADQEVPAGSAVISEGANPRRVHLVKEGLACRYRILPDGRRSIMALLLPGDLCDMQVATLTHMDHSIGTLMPSRIAAIPGEVIDGLLANHPNSARALWWATLVDEAVLREWLVNLGQRRADRRMGHLCCEISLRMKLVGLAPGLLPRLTQEQMADALGITSVHVQRVQRTLLTRGYISIEDRRIRIERFAELAEFSDFDPGYLHLSNADDN